MKTGKMNRLIAFMLALIMMASMFPMGVIELGAADISLEVTDKDEVNEILGKGVNLLDENLDLKKSSLAKEPVFHAFSSRWVSSTDCLRTKWEYTYITDMDKWMQNVKESIDVSVGVGAQFKIVSVKAEAQYGISTYVTNSSENKQEHVTLSAKCEREVPHLTLDYNNINDVWKRNESAGEDDEPYRYLREYFINDLYNLEISAFFEKYGTHLITGFMYGGELSITYTGTKLSKANSFLTEQNVTGSLDVGATGVGNVDVTLALENSVQGDNATEDSCTVIYGECRGGHADVSLEAIKNGLVVTDEWTKSLDESENREILIDQNLMLFPIWDLIIDDAHAARKVELEEYFNEHISAQNAEFYTDYIYNGTGEYNYQDYKTISTAEELNDIRNDLSGKYVLLNDIDLSAYENWTPIGTESDPFTGIFCGNGNTISGLHITSCNGNAAGLFGYNDGTIRNLNVSGEINVTFENTDNNVAYVGGIAGYNSGTIEGCQNNVKVNGELVSNAEESVANAEKTWFDEHSAEIEAAKETSNVQTGTTIAVGNDPVKLTGTMNNVTISVQGSTNPTAYIVLDNAHITGKFVNNPSRNICIIVIGDTSSSITGLDNSTLINMPNARLYICGDQDLVIQGCNGTSGSSGNPGTNRTGTASNGQAGSNGGAGNPGGNGKDGNSPVNVSSIEINMIGKLTIQGGSGGNGGAGGAGGYGQHGGNALYYLFDSSTWGNAGKGGDGGQGGTGGNGGKGAYAIIATTLTVHSGQCYLYGGNSGNGGSGGKGGAGGTGGDASSSDKSAGNGGKGGKGGNSGVVYCGSLALDSNTTVITVNKDSVVYIQRGTTGSSGSVGAGGTGGKGGDFTGGALSWGYDGKDGSSLGSGSIGTRNDYTNSNLATLYSSTSEYKLYTEKTTWESANAKYSGEEKLISVTSQQEQALLQKLMEAAGGGEYWLGMKRRATSGYGFDKFDWADGTMTQVTGTGSTAITNEIDESGNIVGKAYANWAEGEPNNGGGNGEDYIGTSTGYEYKWNDYNSNKQMGYITEKQIANFSPNTTSANALFVGGICGFHSGNGRVVNNINQAAVSAVATSEKSGISAYAGGIIGYNAGTGTFAGAVNNGAVSAKAVSESFTSFADAFANNIAAGKPATAYYGTGELSAYAQSANNLETASKGNDTGNEADVPEEIYTRWPKDGKNLHLEAVYQTTFKVNSSFEADYFKATFDGKDVTRDCGFRYNFYKVRYTNVTVVYESEEGVTYTKTIPVEVKERMPDGFDIKKETIEGIEKDVTSFRTEYIVGEEFSMEGLIFTLTYDNGETASIPYDANNSNFKILQTVDTGKIGEQTLKVSYTDGETVLEPCDITIHVVPVPVSETDPVITASTKTAAAGQTVAIRLDMRNNPGIAYLRMTVKYDEEALTLVEVQNGEIIQDFTSSVNLLWDTDETVYADGTMATLIFRVNEGAADGDYTVDLTVRECYNADMNDVSLYALDGTIRVTDVVYGDVNGDLKVDGRDVLMLCKYMANFDDDTQTSTVEIGSGADANGDGVVNGKDLLLLRKYMANYDDDLGTSSVVLGPAA